jgi:tRNA(Phe) wybutosine-synthesizing methylase Tyw3
MSISSATTPQEKVIVAIRTTAIRLDVPLAAYDTETRSLRPFGLGRGYLITLFNLVNAKFRENELRKQALLESLRRSISTESFATLPETKEERRIKKRQEGLKRQAACRKDNDINTATERNLALDVLDNTLVDHLITI